MDKRDVTGPMKQTADKAREQAREYGRMAAERAYEAKSRVTQDARSLTHEVREQMTEGARAMRDRGQSMIDSRKGQAADEVSHLSGAIRGAADRLRDEQDETIAGYAESLAGQLDRAADYLRDRDLWGMFDDAQRFARRRPELVIGGMFLAGLAIARLVKAGAESSASRHEDPYDGGYGSRDEYGSYSGYSSGFSESEGSAFLGGGLEGDSEPSADPTGGFVSRPGDLADRGYVDIDRDESGAAAPSPGAAEPSLTPQGGAADEGTSAPGSLHAGTAPRPGASTDTDADITRSSDITSGTQPGGTTPDRA